MIRILNVEPVGYSEEARKILRSLGELFEASLDRNELIAQISDYDVLIVRLKHQIDREVIDAATRLKVIVTATTGLDHIDVDYARAKGITVLSLQGEREFLRTVSATAEHTWALLLALLRRIPAAFQSVLDGVWVRDQFKGHELRGKMLGLVGLGRVGRKVARYGFAFEMDVLAYDPFVEDWPEDVGKCSSLFELLRNSDVLSLHIPLNDHTVGLIDKKAFSNLPAGALLVNTSRGEIVDEYALVEALESGKLAGAAVDFLPGERDPARRLASPLLAYARTHDNLLITPHIAGATFESMEKTEIFMARKLEKYIHNYIR